MSQCQETHDIDRPVRNGPSGLNTDYTYVWAGCSSYLTMNTYDIGTAGDPTAIYDVGQTFRKFESSTLPYIVDGVSEKA